MTSEPATPPKLPEADAVPAMLTAAIGQIQFARRYTLELLDATPQDLWFQIPEGLPSNIAWQVGHLAVSQYGLLMFRLRGREPEDLDLVPGKFRRAYARGSKPNADPARQLSASELRERLTTIHDRSMEIVESADTSVLLEPEDMPYAEYPNKLGAVMFCPLHEHIHAGQIGLIRRALELESVR